MKRVPTIADLEPALTPDKDDLDEEHIRQPELIFQCGRGHAAAAEHLELMKHEADITLATLDKKLREELTARSEKFSETSLAKMIDLDESMQTARKDLIQAKFILANWSALVEGFRAKSFSLRELSELYVANYFQTESSKAGHAKARDEVANRVREEASVRRIART